MGKTFVSADWHLDHTNIIRYCERPFASLTEMNEAILDAVNRQAGVRDRIIFVGDLGFFRSLDRFWQIRQQIRCREIHFVWGNHDKFLHKIHAKGSIPLGFASYNQQNLFEIGSSQRRAWVNHYPMITWPKIRYGIFHLHGHCHGSLEDWRSRHMPEARSLDVGIDRKAALTGRYEMWTADEIADYMATKTGEVVDHHAADAAQEIDRNKERSEDW